MSKKKGTAEKAVWASFAPGQKYLTFMRGKDFARSPEMWELATKLAFCDYTKKIPNTVEGITERLKEWDGPSLIAYMIIIQNVIFDCIATGNGQKLRELADAITATQKTLKNEVDPERSWLMVHIYDTDMLTGDVSQKQQKLTFPQIRDAFYNQFPNTSIDESTLRHIIKNELGYICLPERRGPKGPRIRH